MRRIDYSSFVYFEIQFCYVIFVAAVLISFLFVVVVVVVVFQTFPDFF